MTSPNANCSRVKIIIAAHKPYRMPKEPCYIPLLVGAAFHEKGSDISKQFSYYDDSGDNISEKNRTFCELTGLYWAWKNLKADAIGLVHYRRYFAARKAKDPFDRILTDREAKDLVSRYRVIVPAKRRYYIETLYSHYANTHYASHLNACRDIISEKCPDYLEDYETVKDQRFGYMFNMMVLERELMDDYCRWLFSILFELEDRVETGVLKFEQMDSFQGRFYGRISEILFNVWLRHTVRTGRIRASEIKEVPYIYMEKIDWPRKLLSFVKAKFFRKKYRSSF